ncbi:MAG TPA: hypothetical protein VED20_08685 [Streptosporangiaceae bacterium]|nr:hypothetical protein [Streptosporangiaceae bacterium]
MRGSARVKDKHVGDALGGRDSEDPERLLAGQEAARGRSAGHRVDQMVTGPGDPRVVAAVVADYMETDLAVVPRPGLDGMVAGVDRRRVFQGGRSHDPFL